MIDTLATALILWPILTYVIVGIVAFGAGIGVRLDDERVQLRRVAWVALTWPYQAIGLFK